MHNRKATRRIGERRAAAVAALAGLFYQGAAVALGAAASCAFTASAQAQQKAPDDAEFSARVDRAEISIDGSVSLKLSAQSTVGSDFGEAKFHAPDFDVVNDFSSTFVESFYDSSTGRFGMRTNQTLTQVLKPSRSGTLRISGISMRINGKTYSAPDITVQVLASGAATPPPRGYGGGGVGLRGAGKNALAGPSVKVRAEVDKDRVFKGEQVIVSYYLYRRVRVFNIQVDKFPVLNGFLREDLEMPVLGQRLDTERVMLDGVPYERSLLLRYAAYPLQEGKLKIDSAALKYTYYPRVNSMDEEDPFMGFFRQMTPQQGADRSDLLTIDVLPLPEEGKPASFTGGVGDFNVTSAVDKYEVRANEALTLTLKVEGRGNLAAVGEPKAKWPDNVELYDSKGVAKSGRQGVGQKVFEYLLIPRAPGKITLPAMEFSFFDPARKAYTTRTTEPISINVLEPAAGSAVPPARTQRPSADQGADKVQGDGGGGKPVILGLKSPEAEAGSAFAATWRWLYWLCSALFAGLVALVAYDLVRRTKSRSDELARARAKSHSRSWTALREGAEAAQQGAAWADVVRAYETLEGVVFDAIDQAYSVSARSRPRSELREILVSEHGLDPAVWTRISRLLEFAELVRFASSAGAVSEASARSELVRWVNEGEILTQEIGRKHP